MCGIVGFVSNKTELFKLKSMNNIQSHRGPDDDGYFVCDVNHVHMAMTRLSIIDDVGGKQPMKSANNKIVIVFNGEIFNSTEIRKKLERKGVRFKTSHSDTETILKLYELEEENAFHQLNGMFAISIYDYKKNCIFLVRDQLGIKPLFYSFLNHDLSFASEIKALQFSEKHEINKQAIYYYFSRQAKIPNETIYHNINQVNAGSFLKFNLNTKTSKIVSYWKPNIGYLDYSIMKSDDLEELYNSFKTGVARWCTSDTPFALSLSGGLDSSAILSTMNDLGIENINTFSLIYPENADLDESVNAKTLSKKYNTNHVEIEYNGKNFRDDFDKMICALDEPYAGGIPSWFIYKEMSKVVKVCITGTGGDELFGNYGKARVFNSKYLALKRHLGNIIRNGHPYGYLNYPKASKYHPNVFDEYLKSHKLFKQEWLNTFSPVVTENWISNNYINSIDLITEYDLTTQLPEEFLFMTDRFSMAHSLEVRTPFLDIDFVTKVLRLNHKIRNNNQEPKYLLKKIFKNKLPGNIMKGKKKGFVIDKGMLLKDQLKDELNFLLSKEMLQKIGIFNIKYINLLLSQFVSGNKNVTEKIWTVFCFMKWVDKNSIRNF